VQAYHLAAMLVRIRAKGLDRTNPANPAWQSIEHAVDHVAAALRLDPQWLADTLYGHNTSVYRYLKRRGLIGLRAALRGKGPNGQGEPDGPNPGKK
jgi:hypothetical protein